MVRGLRKLLKFVTPFGLVEARNTRKYFAAAGRRLSVAELWRSDQLLHHLDETGLSLIPPQHLASLDCVVDVGANVGQWSSMLLDCVTPHRLILIEPLPEAFAALQQRFANATRLELHNTAIGDATGNLKFHVTRDTTGASVLAPRDDMRELIGSNWSVQSAIDVPVSTLDKLLADTAEVSLLKSDVQGYERAVFGGAQQTLGKTKFLLVELNFMQQYEGGSSFAELHELLTRDKRFYLANATKPLVLNGSASMCDGLYVNSALVPDFAPRDFV